MLQAAAPDVHSLVGLFLQHRLSHQINCERRWEQRAAAGGVCPCETFAAANLGLNQSKCSYGYITVLKVLSVACLEKKNKCKAIKEKAEIDQCAEPGRASHGVSQGCWGLESQNQRVV